MENRIVADTDVIETRFHLHKLEFTPRKSTSSKSNEILMKAITFLQKEKMENKKVYLIDRYQNRKDGPRRELFMYYSVIVPRTKRIKCALALIDNRKKPMIKPKGTFDLVPFDTASGSIAEITHFFIDLNVSPAVMCVEFNNSGPRLSDIEYYFRNITHDKLSLSKATSTSTFMEKGVDELLENIQNVVNFEFKLKPDNITHLDNDIKGYITGVSNLGNKFKPKYIRVEAMFQTPGNKIKSQLVNNEATSFVRNIVKKIKSRPFNIEQFEDFELKYVNKDGEDAMFNLIKGKKEIIIETKRDEHLTTTQWYAKIEKYFNQFIEDL